MKKITAIIRLIKCKEYVLITDNYYDIQASYKKARKYATILYQAEDIVKCERAVESVNELIQNEKH